jgi:hypothetical protein
LGCFYLKNHHFAFFNIIESISKDRNKDKKDVEAAIILLDNSCDKTILLIEISSKNLLLAIGEYIAEYIVEYLSTLTDPWVNSWVNSLID